jgi:hypothetical protein
VLYESTDLQDWQRVQREPVMRPARPHYLDRPDEWRPHVPWRDPFVFRPSGSDWHHALVCAGAPHYGPDHSGALIGRARTRDFVNWELLPPLDAPTRRFYHCEVPEYFQLAGHHHVLFSTGSCYGMRINTPSRRDTVGTYYMVADSPEGPYRLPEDPLLVGAGRGHMTAYVGRTIEHDGGRLFYHHVRNDLEGWDGTWGAPKRIITGEGGALHLEYWPGLAGIEAHEIPLDLRPVPEDCVGEWTLHGPELRGASPAMGASMTLARQVPDAHVFCRVASEAARCGVVLHGSQEHGVGIILDHEQGGLEVRELHRHPVAGWGEDVSGFVYRGAGSGRPRRLLDRVHIPLQRGRPYSLRCFVRERHLEVYLDERWTFTSVLPKARLGGDIHLMAERGSARFRDIRVAELEPLPRVSEGG